MKDLFPTYKEFSRCNDYYRLKFKRRPRNPKWLKVAYYPFALLGLLLLYGVFSWAIALVKEQQRYSYRHDSKYRKVIKEGIFFDTTEYHER